MSSFYEIAVDDDRLRKNPTKFVRKLREVKPDRRPYLTRFEVGTLVNSTRLSRHAQDTAVAMIMTYMGLRVSEVCSLNISSFTYEQDHSVVKFIGKGNKAAVAVVPVAVTRAIDKAIGERTEGPLFLRRDGERVDRRTMTRWVERMIKTAQIDKVITPHSLRRSYITGGLDAGLPVRQVQLGARHSDPRTTIGYDQGGDNMDSHANHTIGAFFSLAS